ncbi:MAG TPA: VWA domain-containing protein [Candidatus Polarisedimenticolaceae bacterium]|nr:VWA domain-containing protein [Candidatus Polarisedimenticolaceae bacterium]
MIPALVRFADALRRSGHPVSPAELIDASRALDLVGLEKRHEVRSALRATLAKDRRSALAFDRLFDAFFTAPKLPGKGEGVGRPAGRGDSFRNSARQVSEAVPSRKLRPQETEPKHPRAAAGANEEGRSERKRDERRPGRLRKRIVMPAPADAASPCRAELSRRMTTDEERALAREIPRLVREIDLRRARRMERARAGRPWMRRAMRESLASGGVPFVLPYRRPKRKTARVILLVDVSFSVARAAGLFLLMASAFLDLGRRARVLAFVDKPVDATAAIARWARGRSRLASPKKRRGARPGDGIARRGVAFADVLDGIEGLNLDAPSDYGRAFHSLLAGRLRPRGRDMVLVVLGDGRTNRFDPLPWALEEIARGCRALIWLVPEPASRWGTADSALPAYLLSVDVVAQANDLDGLAAGVAELVRRL